MSEYSPIATPESTSSEEDTSDSKTKKKKKAIGAFIVEADPQGAFNKLLGKDKKAEKAKKESNKELEAEKPEKTSEAAAETKETKESLETEEKQEVVSQLAAARRQELVNTEVAEITDPVEEAAVDAYLAAAQAEGDVEAAYEKSVAQIEAAETIKRDLGEQAIDPTQPGEGVINLEIEDDQTSTAPLSPSAAGGGIGGSGQPPFPPGGQSPAPFNGGGHNFNQSVPVSAAETTIPLDVSANRARQAQSEGLVVGAIVGYLIGRRRGRIKTEKRLLPVQKKLEKQVKTLQTELLSTETMVRQKVRERTQNTATERATISTARPERQRTPAIIPPERIGHVVMAANLSREVLTVKKDNRTEILSARKQAETMSRQQLLSVSEKVVVEGTTLRKIYETQLVSEKGLRRLVAEHLRGGNVTRALQRELVEREIDFERDPILRDKDHIGGSEAAGKAALAAMLAKVGVSEKGESQSIGTIPAKEKKQSAAKTQNKSNATDIVDVSLITLISVLALAIVVLLFRG